MKLLVTGGHLAPALAFIDTVSQKDVQFVFVGRRYNNLHEKSPSLEYREIGARKIPFYNLPAGRLTRTFSLRSFLNVLATPIGFLYAFYILLRERPAKIVSFGGYLALPTAFMGWLLRVPVYTHEQTTRPGLSNRLIAKIAKKVFVSFPESVSFFGQAKTIVTGNPVRKQVFEVHTKPFTAPDKPVIYITGGSLGSHSINVHIEHILEPLLKDFFVVHQTGNVTEYGDFERLSRLKKTLPEKLQKNYFICEHIPVSDIGYIYKQADLIVSRAGANTFFELIALKKPAILIPLPWSAYREQEHHAQVLKEAGVAEVFDQSSPSGSLLQLIHTMFEKQERYKNSFTNLDTLYLQNAADRIYQEIMD